MIRIPVWAACTAALSGTALFAASAQAALPGRNGIVAFARGGAIWTVRADGQHERRLTPRVADENDGVGAPSFSPSGRRIVYAGGLLNELRVMSSDGRHRRVLYRPSAGSTVGQPAFSPDGKRVVFGYRGGLAIVAAAGGHLRRLPVDPGNTLAPSWSVRGTIAWGCDAPDIYNCNDRLHTLDARGHGRRTFGSDLSARPDWSPDGRQLVYGHEEFIPQAKRARPRDAVGDSLDDVHLIQPDGRGDRSLTTDHVSGQPAFSPDGAQITYASGDAVWLMGADGSRKRRLVTGLDPAWQPVPSR